MVGRVYAIDRLDRRDARVHDVTGAARLAPPDEDVIDASVRLEVASGEGIVIRPGEPGPVAGPVPRVHENETGGRGGGAAGEHADLVGVGFGVEVAADDRWVRATRRLPHEPGQRPALRPHDDAL